MRTWAKGWLSTTLAILLAGRLACFGQTLQKRPDPQASPPVAAAPSPAAPASETLAPGTSLQVELLNHAPMKAGQSLEARLLHPIYVDGKIVVPEGALVHGSVIALEPDAKARWHARLRGDFTPFHRAQVRFDSLELQTGPLPLAAGTADRGAPVLHLVAAGMTPKQSFVSKQWHAAMDMLHRDIALLTAPGKADRALQFFYHQLPYHPERIEAHTAWTFELTQPAQLPANEAAAAPEIAASPSASGPAPASAPASASSQGLETWQVHALLTGEVTSATAKPGDAVQALVVEPVYDTGRTLVIPQGATLVGRVTTAQAARSFGRNGKLRFNFQEVRFPAGFDRPVEGALNGANTDKTQNLKLDAEGTISPRNQSSAVAPLLLSLLAERALDADGNLYADNAVASNGFGLVGRVVGIATGNRNVAAGLGYYAAGLSFYENFLTPGRDVDFPKDTRIEIQTMPLRAPVLSPGTRQ